MTSIRKRTFLAAAMLVLAGTVPAVAQHAHDRLHEQPSFDYGVAAYMTLRDEATRAIPPLSVTADAALIASNVVARAAAIRAARVSARSLDVFTSEGARQVRAIVGRVVRDRGEQLTEFLAKLQEGDREERRPAVVNASVEWSSVSAMPADLLAVLPWLPAALEYRFIGRDLALIDVDASLIVDVLRVATDLRPCCCDGCGR